MPSVAGIRETLCEIIDSQCKDSCVALLLSGGVDSLSLGFAANDVGKVVVAYTFQIGEWESPDSVAAKRSAKEFGWEFELIKVPVGNLRQDFIALADRYSCRKKTQFECTFPFLYVFPVISERFVLSGVAADGHYGLSRKAMTEIWNASAYERQDVFCDLRQGYFSGDNPAGVRQLEMLAANYEKNLIAPYLERSVFDLFIEMEWDEINKPQQKIPVLRACKEEFTRIGTRKHLNLQLAAGIDRVFESLLSSDLNKNNRTRVMDLCRDYAR